MKSRIALIVFIIFLILIIYIGLVIKNIISFADAIPICISVIALFVSIISVFKNELFPHDLMVFIDNFHLVSAGSFTSKNEKTIQPMPTLTFYNRGYGECSLRNIQMIVRLLKRDIGYAFIPAFEIDMEDMIRQRKGINASNAKNTFCGFLIEPKKGISKTIVFAPDVSKKGSEFCWKEDEYKFEIYVQIHGEEKIKKYCEKEIDISNNTLSRLLHGVDVLNIMDK